MSECSSEGRKNGGDGDRGRKKEQEKRIKKLIPEHTLGVVFFFVFNDWPFRDLSRSKTALNKLNSELIGVIAGCLSSGVICSALC